MPNTHVYHAYAESLDGFSQWVDLVAARADNPIPLVVCAQDKKLTTSRSWTWTSEFAPEDIERLSKAYSIKAELAPKYKFGVQIPKAFSRHCNLIESMVMICGKNPSETKCHNCPITELSGCHRKGRT